MVIAAILSQSIEIAKAEKRIIGGLEERAGHEKIHPKVGPLP